MGVADPLASTEPALGVVSGMSSACAGDSLVGAAGDKSRNDLVSPEEKEVVVVAEQESSARGSPASSASYT